MSGELRIAAATGGTVYANILNGSSQRWNGSAFETFASAHYNTYAITTVEQGSTGVYVGNFPVAITDAADYEIIFYSRDGAAVAEGDPIVGTASINWDGDSVAADEDVAAGEMTGIDWQEYVLRTFKRTDKSDELFDATNAAVAEIRRKLRTGRDEKETTFTDTIATLGEFRLDLESDVGQIIDVFVRDTSNGRYLERISKEEYDDNYGKWGTTSFSGPPCHYCVFGGQVLIGPVPDSISYTYVTSYSRANLTPVTLASLSIPYTTQDYKELMGFGTLWRLYKGVENDDQAGAYKALWDDGLNQIETRERRNRRSVSVVAYTDV